MVTQESKQTLIDPNPVENNGENTNLFSPRFKSLAAMAGWDEESLLVASLIVEDTPDRQFKLKRRSDSHFKTPPSNSSRRKRRNPRKSPISVSVISLDDEKEPEKPEIKEEVKVEIKNDAVKDEIKGKDEMKKGNSSAGDSCSNLAVPCMDKLREELSCAICLEICFEPSTTSCGHSFCKKCLKSAADKCGKKCPKCRQLISNGRSCTVNTVLWNTIQLLFPQEVEARKAAAALNSREADRQIPPTRTSTDARNRPLIVSTSSRDQSTRRRGVTISQDEDSAAAQRTHRDDVSRLLSSYASGISRTPSENDMATLNRNYHRNNFSRLVNRLRRIRGGTPNQDADAALALRMQREEFMEAFRATNEQSDGSLSPTEENFRAIASRGSNLRTRSLRNR